MDADRTFIARLSGGKRQSIGDADVVAREVQADPDRAEELWDAVWFADPLVAMRAVDALEKASATHPEVLRGHESEILEDLPGSELPEVRWHVGLLVPRLPLTARQMPLAAQVLERLLTDPSRIVSVNALDGIVHLADRHPELAEAADAAMTRASRSPYASVRARARRLTR